MRNKHEHTAQERLYRGGGPRSTRKSLRGEPGALCKIPNNARNSAKPGIRCGSDHSSKKCSSAGCADLPSTARGAWLISENSDKIFRRPTPEELPLTWGLLEMLEDGVTPKILDIMGAISEFVAFYTDYDIESEDQIDALLNMSGKKCRNCS